MGSFLSPVNFSPLMVFPPLGVYNLQIGQGDVFLWLFVCFHCPDCGLGVFYFVRRHDIVAGSIYPGFEELEFFDDLFFQFEIVNFGGGSVDADLFALFGRVEAHFDFGISHDLFADVLGFAGGEDYVLLCTVPSDKANRLAKDYRKRFNQPLYAIGEITNSGKIELVQANGQIREVEPSGWDHFKTVKKTE